MVIAVSNTKSTLWDQIQYTGQASDFVWVLPTPTPADVQLSHVEFFDALETTTAPVVYGPVLPRSTSSGGAPGCGGSANFAAGSATNTSDNVTVYHQGEVGPYETATVGSDDPMALTQWLNDHGYSVPPALDETIAFYVQKKWVFNALRLNPDATTTQMKPVRVTFDGLAATFPLRMVAAGAADSIGLLLWIIADQRYESSNYDTVPFDGTRLLWSTTSQRSNYRETFDAMLGEHPAGAFIAEYAQPVTLGSIVPPVASDDLTVLLDGQPTVTWLTRLRTTIAPSLLTKDLQLAPSASGTAITNVYRLNVSNQTSASFATMLVVLCGLGIYQRQRHLRRRKRP